MKQTLKGLYLGVILGGIAFGVTQSFYGDLIKSAKRSGAIITVQDYVSANHFPILAGILFFIAGYKLGRHML